MIGSRAPSPGTSGALQRDLLLFHVYRFLSTSYLFAPVLVLFFKGRGLSFTEITLLNTVYAGTAAVFEVPTGALADRFGRRRAMALGALLMAAGCAVDWAGRSFVAFAAGEGLLALGMTLSSGADSAWLYDLLLEAGREREYRKREGTASAAKLVGAALALSLGGRLALRDLPATYLASALVCMAACLAALALREVRPARSSTTRGPSWRTARRLFAQMAAGARTVASHPPLRFAVLFSTLVFSLVRMGIYLHQPVLSAAGYDVTRVGDLMAALSLVAALGAARVGDVRRLLGERTLVVALPAVLALSYAALGAGLAAIVLPLLSIQCFVNGVYSPFSKELLNREIVDSGQRATILSVESMARRLVFGAAAPVAGVLIDRRGLEGGLFACAILGAMGALALAAHVARRRGSMGRGFEGERTPTPLPALPSDPVSARHALRAEPAVVAVRTGERSR